METVLAHDRFPHAAAAAGGPDDNKRMNGRANLLLPATIEAGLLIGAVRIRNLSETGAAIDGPVLPRTGAAVTLRRGDLAIDGAVVWVSGMRCGIHFRERASVADWVFGTRTPPEGVDQRRVDAIQAAVRTGAPALPTTTPAAPSGASVAADLDARLSREIGLVRELLEKLGDELTEEPAVLMRHTRALQSFDLANQILGHISAILVADDRRAAVQAIGMEELRGRLLRAAADVA